MTSRLLVIVGAVSYVLAWLLPVIKVGKADDFLGESMLRGWEGFWFALMYEWPDKGDPPSEWTGFLLTRASALSNFILAGALLDVFLNADHPHPFLRRTLFACAVLNTHWLPAHRDGLRIGYYLWAGSFFLIAAGLATTGGVAASWTSTGRFFESALIVISAGVVLAGLFAWMHLVSRTEAYVTEDPEHLQYQDTFAKHRGNKMHDTSNERPEKTRNDPSSASEKAWIPPPSATLVKDDSRHSKDNWGTELLKYFVHPFALTATPIFLFLLTAYFVFQGFQEDLYVGFRSLCGALLPLILITFIHEFRKDLLVQLGSQNTLVSLILSSVWGFSLMLILRVFNRYLHNIPLNELILSGSFSVLIFTYYYDEENRAKAYYYGLIAGLLIYIILFGFPIDILHR